MIRKIAAVTMVLIAAAAARAAEDTPDASSPLAADGVARVKSGAAPIAIVVVYPDGAMVTRTAKASVPAGASIIVFDDLTPTLDEASLRARVTGAKVTGVSADWQGNEKPSREAEAKWTSEIEKISADVQTERDRQQSLAARKQVLEQYRNLSKEAMGEGAGSEKSATAAPGDKAKWAAAVAFVTKESASIATDLRASNVKLEDLGEKLNAAQQELGKIRAASSVRTRRVEVEIEADKAADVAVELDYTVRDAWWSPAYDARSEGATLSVTAFGTVTQASGEDWKNVAMTLSTSRPSEGAQVPVLPPKMLSGSARKKQPVQIVSYGKEKSKDFGGGKVSGTPQQNGQSPRVQIDDHGNGVVFRISGKESVPADRRPHKVEIATLPLEAALAYETIPKIDPWVFLKATAKNSGTFPLLAGPVDVFRSSGYVGTGHLEYIAPGEEFSVSLGTDDDLKVRRVIDERVDTKPKFLEKTRSLTYAYSIDVSNFKETAQTVTLVENLPVTQRKEIKITLRDGSTKPDKQDDEGFLNWKVALKPGETKTIYFGYLIEYPSDFQLGGI